MTSDELHILPRSASHRAPLPEGPYVFDVISGEPLTLLSGYQGWRYRLRLVGTDRDEWWIISAHGRWAWDGIIQAIENGAAIVGGRFIFPTRPETYRGVTRTHVLPPIAEMIA